MQLNHLHLRVTDVARSRGFYERFFGLREHVWHGDILFMTDDARFDLALAPAREVERFPAWFHFGFRLASAGDVRRMFDDMKAAGVTLLGPLEEEEEEGLISFRCGDPDCHTIEVYWE